MPFYLAIPRKSGAGSEAGTGRSQFQRTSPSRLVLTIMSKPQSWVASVLSSDISFLAHSIQKRVESGRQVTTSLDRRSFFPEIRISDSLPIFYPDIMIHFGGAVSDNVRGRLEELGASLDRFPQLGNKEAYLLRSPTSDIIPEILRFPNINNKSRPPFDAITPDGILALYTIVTRITAGAKIANVIWRVGDGDERGLLMFPDSDTRNIYDGTLLEKEGDEQMDKDQREEGELSNAGEEFSSWESPQGTFFKLIIGNLIDEATFGPATEIPVGPGLFLPFEPNYSQPDEGAINLFLSRFYRISVQDPEDADEELDDLMRFWVTEIANTKMGQFLAHMITSLDLALRGGVGVYFIFRDNSTYEGSVLRGEFSLKQVGMSVVTSQSATELAEDVASFGFHATSVREIVELMDADLDFKGFETLRSLRSLVYRDGAPSGQMRNRIEKLLQNVSFNEKPLTLTLQSFEKIYGLLANPIVLVPNDLYLHRKDFFTEMRVQLILSAFGNRIPCLSYGGQTKLRASRKLGKGTSDISPRAPEPPSTFQFKMIDMAGAIPLWNAMMTSGIISTDTTTRVPGSRVITGLAKRSHWESLAVFLDQVVIEKGTVPNIPDRRIGDEGQKRGATDDGAEGRKKRLRSFF
jgi:hypothetical protein